MNRRVLVVHTRMPAFDRDAGSQLIDTTIRFLIDAGWSVTFLCKEEEGVAEERHASRLRQMGVATYAGFSWAERVVRSNSFDLAIVAFWELAATMLPMLRAHSPSTRVVVNSIDVHLLRNARRSFGQQEDLARSFGDEAAKELNTYNAADAVIAVSEKEQAFLGDFVGNFRHLPNQEAVEYLCGEVLPLVDPALLERHPLTVLGNWLDRVELAVDPHLPGVRLVGWVPTVEPYVQRSRLAVVPLLHGAGVKHKVIQAMMSFTPVVTTPVGAEGLDLVQGEHALIARDAADMAAGITRALTEDDLWRRLAAAGADHVDQRHGLEVVRRRFDAIIDAVVGGPGAGGSAGGGASLPARVRARIHMVADPGAPVVVASGGDEALVDLGSQPCWHFPQGRDGGWAGFDPVDGPSAVSHLESLRSRGARYFVLPRPAFTWRHRYPELHEHLESAYQRVHQDEHLVMYDLAAQAGRPVLATVAPSRVVVLGTYAEDRSGPPPALVAELSASIHDVEQHWAPSSAARRRELPDADHVVFVRDDAVLPRRFVDDLVAAHAAFEAERLQPAHVSGPAAGPPITERHRGVVAREIDEVTSLPVLSVRSGAALEGPVVLTDAVTLGLRHPVPRSDDRDPDGFVRRVWLRGEDGRPVVVDRHEPEVTPRISVLIATYNRTDLLRECLASFAKQTIDRSEYEVVVVDDGSDESVLDDLVEEFGEDLQIAALRIAHAGRSAAKNHCVLLARAPIVLFFDDDDRAAPDYLEAHLRGHEREPAENVAILGHTDWAPELELSPLMHYVTDVDRLLFAYERLRDGQELDWRGFWEGRISCKRSLLVHHGLHDQRLNYSIDIEMAWRLAERRLRVVYESSARSVMARPIDLEAFCARTVAKGRAHAVIAALPRGAPIAVRLGLDGASALWAKHGNAGVAALRAKVASLEARADGDEAVLAELHRAYRELFRLLHAKGVAEATTDAGQLASNGGVGAAKRESAPTVTPFLDEPTLVHDGTPEAGRGAPLLSVTLPVWSRTPELAEMAASTIERIWEVARIPTEVVVIDNGSPYETPLAGKVYRYAENRGVSSGWNTGIRLSTAPVVCVLNSDCRVEPGWDEALYEAATDGRRIAFPYTDHCDGKGFTQPDQAGTAGWCFMVSREIYDEVGVFDEWFSPAFVEDTDYWHRAWELGIELSPVPAARVTHARRTTGGANERSEWLLLGHRYKYGWKHGVDPLRAPPYYNREIVEYHGKVQLDATDRADLILEDDRGRA